MESQFSAREILEQSWEEIEFLEDVIADQEREIENLRAQLAKLMPKEESLQESCRSLSSTTTATSTTQSYQCEHPTPSSSSEGSNVSGLVVKAFGFPADSCGHTLQQHPFDLLQVPLFSVLAQKAMQVAAADSQLRQVNERQAKCMSVEEVGYLFKGMQNQPTKPAVREENLQDKDSTRLRMLLHERDKVIASLEMELEQIKCTTALEMERLKSEVRRLEMENQYREEQMMHLQSQLAQYMLHEVKHTRNGSIAL